MTLIDDPWVVQNSPIPAERLHALGVISFRWNGAEISLKLILISLMRIPLFTLWPLIHEMGDIAICTAIKETMANARLPAEIVDRIQNVLEVYEINRINRNQLTHFLPGAFATSSFARMKGPRFDPQPFPDDVKDIRRVADEITALVDHMGKVHNVIQDRRFALPGGPNKLNLEVLPDRLPVPEKLWKPPPPKPQGRKGQPGKEPG